MLYLPRSKTLRKKPLDRFSLAALSYADMGEDFHKSFFQRKIHWYKAYEFKPLKTFLTIVSPPRHYHPLLGTIIIRIVLLPENLDQQLFLQVWKNCLLIPEISILFITFYALFPNNAMKKRSFSNHVIQWKMEFHSSLYQLSGLRNARDFKYNICINNLESFKSAGTSSILLQLETFFTISKILLYISNSHESTAISK